MPNAVHRVYVKEWRRKIREEDPARWKQICEAKNAARKKGKYRDRADRLCRDCGVSLTPLNNLSQHGRRCRSCFQSRASTLQRARGGNKWRKRNRDYLAEKNREWHATHPGARSVYAQNYRAKHGVAPRSTVVHSAPGRVTRAEWNARLEEFNHTCAYCLCTGVRLSQDHMVARTAGGLHSIVNVVSACRSCNSRKNDRPIFAALTS